MSTFMEHIHRDTDARALDDDDTELVRHGQHDRARSDDGGPVGPARAMPLGDPDAGTSSGR